MLAETNALRAISDYMSHPMAMRGGGIMLFAGLSFAAFWVAMHYWENFRLKAAVAQQTPTALFQELCRLHDLTWEQIHFLQTTVQDHHELPLLFVDPELLESFAKTHPAQTISALKLRDTLFGARHPSHA